jgi:hypothetical protein
MQRPTPLLPTVTTPINLWPYKSWAKGNLRRGNWTETKEEPSINKEKKGARQGEETQKNTDKRKAKNEKKKERKAPRSPEKSTQKPEERTK